MLRLMLSLKVERFEKRRKLEVRRC